MKVFIDFVLGLTAIGIFAWVMFQLVGEFRKTKRRK